MKKSILPILCGIFLFISCDKLFLDVEGSEADLQGKWQMDEANTVFYNFQKNLFEYQIYLDQDSILSVFGYYTLHGDTAVDLELIAEQMYMNQYPSTEHSLNFLGWDTLYSATGQDTLFRTFQIKKLEKRTLTLSHKAKNYTFHKF